MNGDVSYLQIRNSSVGFPSDPGVPVSLIRLSTFTQTANSKRCTHCRASRHLLVRIVLEIILGPLVFMGPECHFELAQGPLKACLTGRRQREEIEAPNAYGFGAKRKRL
jgi:hypothetical protein